jgi:hypothetical protein
MTLTSTTQHSNLRGSATHYCLVIVVVDNGLWRERRGLCWNWKVVVTVEIFIVVAWTSDSKGALHNNTLSNGSLSYKIS